LQTSTSGWIDGSEPSFRNRRSNASDAHGTGLACGQLIAFNQTDGSAGCGSLHVRNTTLVAVSRAP
jgi:hypothetical protein